MASGARAVRGGYERLGGRIERLRGCIERSARGIERLRGTIERLSDMYDHFPHGALKRDWIHCMKKTGLQYGIVIRLIELFFIV